MQAQLSVQSSYFHFRIEITQAAVLNTAACVGEYPTGPDQLGAELRYENSHLV